MKRVVLRRLKDVDTCFVVESERDSEFLSFSANSLIAVFCFFQFD